MQEKTQELVELPATSSETTDTSSPDVSLKPSKLNRAARRRLISLRRKEAKHTARIAAVRKTSYQVLSMWMSSSQLPDTHKDTVFKVMLNRLFKREFTSAEEFSQSLMTVERNVRRGFQYRTGESVVQEENTDTNKGSEQ